MLNYPLKTGQKRLCRVHAHEQQHGKHVRLQPPARAIAGHIAHGQRRQHHGSAEVISHWQPVFWLVENVLNDFHLVAVLYTTTFCHTQMGQNFRYFVSLSNTSYMRGSVYLGFASQRKNNKLRLIYRKIKSQDDSLI